jgi:hypothetical protein
MFLAELLGWLEREQHDVIAFLREENRTLKSQPVGRRATQGRRRLRVDETQRRRPAVPGQRLGRGALRDVARLVTQKQSSGGIAN